MREKIKDRGRLEHILSAINGIMADKDLYTLEQIKSSTILFYGFTKYVEIIGDAACGAICTDYVGDVLLLSDAELGDELPPYHPNCACSYIAYTDVSPEEDDLEYGYEEVDDE